MFEFAGGRKASESKCYVTHGAMGHLDPKQPPVKRKPYAAILAVPFVHKVRKPQLKGKRFLTGLFTGRTHSSQRALWSDPGWPGCQVSGTCIFTYYSSPLLLGWGWFLHRVHQERYATSIWSLNYRWDMGHPNITIARIFYIALSFTIKDNIRS